MVIDAQLSLLTYTGNGMGVRLFLFCKNNSNIFVQIKEKKPAEKWYALLYLLELKATKTKPPTNYEGDFIRKDIEEIGKKELVQLDKVFIVSVSK